MKSRLRRRLALALALSLHAGSWAAPAPGQGVPDVCFTDVRGKPACLSQWRGRVVLLNLWATWCVPCRLEMPQLDHVQGALGGRHFEVIALSVDRRGAAAVANFYERTGVRKLAIYVDAEMRSAEALSARGIPLSLLIDRQGRVVQRISGPVDWEAADKVAAIRQLIAE